MKCPNCIIDMHPNLKGQASCWMCGYVEQSKCGYAFHDADVAALGYCAACVQNILGEDGQMDFFKAKPEPTRCECGAQHTRNPECHAFYCPEYKK